jgi:uncharacterized membrane protein
MQRDLGRIAAFTDGVMAVAITLLVLNIEVPDVPGSELGRAISDLGSAFLAYAIGFAVMGLFWYGHHKLFAQLGRSSPRLVWVNMLQLAFMALMPFTTALLGRYDEPLAVTLYAVNVGVAALLDGLTEVVAARDHLYLEAPPDPVRARRVMFHATTRALVFFVSIPLAYAISPSFAKWFWLLLILVGVRDRRFRRRARPEPAPRA